MKRRRAFGADSINIQKSNDPFGYDKKSGEQAQALKTAKKAKPSFGPVAKAVGSMLAADRYANAKQRAEAGMSFKAKGLTPKQLSYLRRVQAGKEKGY
jgi:hypothetical protein